MSHVDVDALGCLPMDASGGTTDATAAANAALLNAYLATNWGSGKRPLFFPGSGWLINDTIDLQDISGHALFGAGGETTAFVEQQYWPAVPTTLKGGGR